MPNYSLKIDLSKLEGFGEIKLVGKSGVPTDCIVIPKEKNHIFCSEKGARYLDLNCFETPNSEYGTHLVTLAKTQEEREHEKATGERISRPILGNLKEFGSASSASVETYSMPNAAPAQPTKKQSKTAAPTAAVDDDSDLPF